MAGSTWLPIDRIRPCRVSEANGPAIILPVEQHDLPFLVVGEGDAAVACILGEKYPFEGMPLATAGNHKGLAIEGIRFEVDLDTMYAAEGRFTAIFGSLIRTGTALDLLYKGDDFAKTDIRSALHTT